MWENRSKLMLLIILISCYQYNWTKWKYFYLLFFALLLGYTSEEYLFIFLSFSPPRRDNCVHKWFWIADRHEITLVLDTSHYFLSFVTLYGGDRFAMVQMNKDRQKRISWQSVTFSRLTNESELKNNTMLKQIF